MNLLFTAFLQDSAEELAKGFLSYKEATVAGILIVFIIICLIAIRTLYKSKEEQSEYIREQDKANVAMLTNVAALFKDIPDAIKGIEQGNQTIGGRLIEIEKIIKQKLLNMN